MELSLVGVLASIGLATPVAIGVAFDRIIRREIKEKLSRQVFGTDGKFELSNRLKAISDLLGFFTYGTVKSKISKISALAILSLFLTVAFQYFYNRDSFENQTKKFLELLLAGDAYAILCAISFVIVDVVSFFQTSVFLRISQNVKNYFELILIAIADFLTSLFLVILILPALLMIAFQVTYDNSARELYLAFDSRSSEQIMDVRDVLRMNFPGIRKNEGEELDTESKSIFDLFEQKKWLYQSFQVSMSDTGADKKLSDAAKGLGLNSGSFLYFESGNEELTNLSNRLSQIMMKANELEYSKIEDSDSSIFGRQLVLFKIKSKPHLSFSAIFDSYLSNMSDVNFLGNDLRTIFELSAKTLSKNDIVWNASVESDRIAKPFDLMWLSFDDKPVSAISSKEGLILKKAFEKCEKGVAVPDGVLYGNNVRMNYFMANDTAIPVLPLSLSSIFFTILIYALAACWVIFPILDRLSKKYFEQREKIVIDNVFTLISVVFMSGMVVLFKLLSSTS